MARLKVLIWHVHGSYLYYLAHAPHDFYVLSKPERPPGYTGRSGHIPWPENVHDMPVHRLGDYKFDCIIYQSPQQYHKDQHELLTPEQRRAPKIYIEHDPPQEHPTDTPHPVDDPEVLLIHVTHFNRLMWNSRATPVRVIEHGVIIPERIRYSGELARGIVVINHLKQRGRRLGADVFEEMRAHVPLDLVGMDAELLGGLGEVIHKDLCAFQAHYRFFFNPIRYTSLGLAVIEAMMVGLPIVGLATTEMVTTIQNGINGYVHTDPALLKQRMADLIQDPEHAWALGESARNYALERFNIERFARDWDDALRSVAA